jgi:Reverse transcriptase (RNA-dependent DNA polymerase)/RNase H-like domain found in reverse transcriptase/Aspartyl protease
LEDGTEQILSMARNQAISVQGMFQEKVVTILVDTGCNIMCISSHIASRNEWKKVHGDLKVRGFNGGLVKCPAKMDLEWEMGDISSSWKDAWVLPAMSYNIIIGTDWMEKHHPHIDFTQCTISVGANVYKMENVREDLIHECNTITTRELEALLTDDKIMEITAWNISKVKGQDLTEEKRDVQMDTLLKEFANVFLEELRPPLDRSEHNFWIWTVVGAKPQIRKHGRLSERETKEMKKKIKELLTAGHIKPSISPWSALILFVWKKDGTLRLCIDYRALNAVTLRDEYSLPQIDAIFNWLAKAKFFSTLDLNMAYHQVPLDEDSRECTGFTCEERHYQFKVMTFSFTNAPPTFQRMMSDYLGDMVGQFVEVYLDDILIHSETWEDHLAHLRLVLNRLRRVGLYAKMKKCTWGKRSVRYLSHIIENGKLLVDDDKVKAIQEWKRPTTGKELQWFLGLVNYYREFIQDLAKIGWSLYEVKREEVLEWTSKMEITCKKIRKMAANLPYRVLWDPKKWLWVWTDSSEDGMGMVLEQLEKKGWYPLAFFSRIWRTNEKNWPTHHQEMATFVEALQKW